MTTTRNQLPANLQPLGTICVPIFIPDDTEWLWLVVKALSHAAQKRYWLKGNDEDTQVMIKEWESRVLTPFIEKIMLAEVCGSGTMSCEDVADCVDDEVVVNAISNIILNNPTIFSSITETVNNAGYGNPNIVNSAQTTPKSRNLAGTLNEPLAELANCDLNALWGAIRHGIVERLNDVGKDLLEDLAAESNVIARTAQLVGAIPVLGSVLETVAEQIATIVPDILALYESHESAAVLDDIACEIFGIVCAECRFPTFTEIFDVYRNIAGIADDLESMTVDYIAEKVLTLLFAPAEIAYGTTLMWALMTLALQATWNGLNGTQAVQIMIDIGEDSANDNWLLLCATCNEQWQIEEFDFTQSTHGFSLYPLNATPNTNGRWEAGIGWVGTDIGSGVSRVVIGRNDLQPIFRIRGAGFHYDPAKASPNLAQSGISFRPVAGSNTGIQTLSLTSGTIYNRSNCLLTGIVGMTSITLTMTGVTSDNPVIQRGFITYDAGFGRGERASSRAIC